MATGAKMVRRTCEVCKRTFLVRKAQLRQRPGRVCSIACRHEAARQGLNAHSTRKFCAPYRKWKPSEIEALRLAIERGDSIADIEKATGRTAQSVQSMVKLLGLRHKRRWSDKEDSRVLSTIETQIPDSKLAVELGRSIQAIQSRRSFLVGLGFDYDALSLENVASILRIERSKIEMWMRSGFLRFAPGTEVIKARDLRQFIVSNPDEIDLGKVKKAPFLRFISGLRGGKPS